MHFNFIYDNFYFLEIFIMLKISLDESNIQWNFDFNISCNYKLYLIFPKLIFIIYLI